MTGNSQIVIRDAEAADLAALVAVRPPEALHRGRLRDAQSADYRYFVLLRDHEIIGFCSLVFRRPPTWSNANDEQHLPQIVDLHIAESQRGQGYGSEAIRAMERITFDARYRQLYIAVDPLDNPHAYALYQRLGYQQLQFEPYFHIWESIDGDGKTQRGEVWLVDMVKSL
jgi:RimJ/RimL family protein N-acetyltransferase